MPVAPYDLLWERYIQGSSFQNFARLRMKYKMICILSIYK